MHICICYDGGISPTWGGGVASVILNIINETKDKIDYTVVTNYNERDFCEARSVYDSTIRLVTLRSLSNPLFDTIEHLLNSPTRMFDVFHFHNLPIGRSLLHALKLYFMRANLVFSYHFRREDTRYFPCNCRMGVEYYKLGFNCLSNIWRKIIVNSRLMLEDLKRCGDCVSKAVVIPNGVNISDIQESPRLSLSGDPSFLYVGHLERHKGIDILLRAFSRLLKEKNSSKMHLHLVGAGSLKTYYQNFAYRKKIEDRVHFWGSLPQKAVFRLLKSCDIFVLPSRSEASPIVLLEAMAAEKPIISTDVGGVREILTDNRNAFLVKPKETELSRAMKCLAENGDLRKTFSKNNREDVIPFSWKHISPKYVDLYRSIANI